MDVTPQELRGSEIKEAFRGYHRDEVDDLLERAAVTIENLTRQVQESAARGPSDASSAQFSREDAETIQRTLILAQRAADDAIAEAQARAHLILEESEAKAQTLVGEAEATARRIHESERRRLEAEISELVVRRDQLAADADAIEEYASGYRDRVRAAIESDLASLGTVIEPPLPRPSIPESVSEPIPAEPVAQPTSHSSAEPAFASSTEAASSAEPPSWADDPATQAVSSVAPEPAADAYSSATVPASTMTHSPAPAPAESEWPPAPTDSAPLTVEGYQPRNDMPATPPFASDVAMEARPVDPDALDDDAFFASLRDAVRDDTPLGPVDDAGEQSPFFDDAKPEETHRRFRRR